MDAMTSGLFVLTLIAALGCGLVAGVLFAFSAFVMHALNRLPSAQGIAAMQSINVSAVRPAFMAGLFGTAAICLALAVVAFATWGDRRAVLLLVGSALYLGGTILLTIVLHVPLNDALATVDPNSTGAASHWTAYVGRWTAWNHVRVAAALAAGTAFMLALTA